MLTSLRISDERYKPAISFERGGLSRCTRWDERVYDGPDPVDDAATYDDYIIEAAHQGWEMRAIGRLLQLRPDTIGDRVAELCNDGTLEKIPSGVAGVSYRYRRAQ